MYHMCMYLCLYVCMYVCMYVCNTPAVSMRTLRMVIESRQRCTQLRPYTPDSEKVARVKSMPDPKHIFWLPALQPDKALIAIKRTRFEHSCAFPRKAIVLPQYTTKHVLHVAMM